MASYIETRFIKLCLKFIHYFFKGVTFEGDTFKGLIIY